MRRGAERLENGTVTISLDPKNEVKGQQKAGAPVKKVDCQARSGQHRNSVYRILSWRIHSSISVTKERMPKKRKAYINVLAPLMVHLVLHQVNSTLTITIDNGRTTFIIGIKSLLKISFTKLNPHILNITEKGRIGRRDGAIKRREGR